MVIFKVPPIIALLYNNTYYHNYTDILYKTMKATLDLSFDTDIIDNIHIIISFVGVAGVLKVTQLVI